MDQTISRVDFKILLAVNQYDCLTIEQVKRIFNYKSYTATSEKLKLLSDLEVLERKKLPHEIWGGATWLYKVGRVGRELLRDEGLAPPRFVMGASRVTVSTHWWHTVFVNDFFISAHLYAQTNPQVEIAQELHELDIKRDKRFPASGVIPDGWIDFHVSKEYRYCFFLELERDTRAPIELRRKIENLVNFAHGPYEEVFGTDILTYLFFANNEAHRREIVSNIAVVLREMGKKEANVLFQVTDTKPSDVFLFSKACWYIPSFPTPVTLFEG
jgi:hypothetical protein